MAQPRPRSARSRVLLLLVGLAVAAVFGVPGTRARGQAASPVRSGVCAGCHAPDARGRQEVIDSIHTTPEGWRRIVARMERMYGVKLEAAEREAIVRDLADRLPLSPAEYRDLQARIAETGVAAVPPPRPGDAELPADFERTCTACHNMDVIWSQRRTPEAWKRLRDMHLGTWPILFITHRDMRWDERSLAAVQALAKQLPLHPSPGKTGEKPLAGEYAVAGVEPGAGGYTGRVTLSGKAPEYTWTERLVYDDGRAVEGSGQAVSFAGYLLEMKGRRGDQAVAATVFRPSGDGVLEGRWKGTEALHLRGTETWAAVSGPPRLLHLHPSALVAPGSTATVTATLSNGASRVQAAGMSFGDLKVARATPEGDRLRLELALPANPKPGYRTLKIPGVAGEARLAVAPAVGHLRIQPEEAVSHLGGGQPPPVGVQFEARGGHSGPDGQPWTADDVDLGPMPVTWRMDDYASTNWDDDPKWVGKLDEKGLFTPSDASPNPKRKRMMNSGDVWVVATHRPEGVRQPLRARVLLRVVVPDFREDL